MDLRTAGTLLISLLFVWRFNNKEAVLVVLAAGVGIVLRAL